MTIHESTRSAAATQLRSVAVALATCLLAETASAQTPVAHDQSVFLNEGNIKAFTLGASGLSGPGPVIVTILEEPTNGTLVQLDTFDFEYTPNEGFYGLDTFRWQVNDGEADSNVALCRLGVNQKPVAIDGWVITGKDTPKIIRLKGSDDGHPGPYEVTIVTPTEHGTLTEMSLGQYEFVPDLGFIGQDKFTWYVHDGMAFSNTARVDIGVNDAPVANPAEYRLGVNQSLVNWLPYDDDDFPKFGTVSLKTGPVNGVVNLLDERGRFEYIPAPDFVGSDSFTWEVDDGDVTSNTETVSLAVVPRTATGLEIGIAFPLSGPDTGVNNAEFNTQHFEALNVGQFRFNGADWSTLEATQGVFDWTTLETRLEFALVNGYSAFLTVPSKAPDWACDPTKQVDSLCVPVSMVDFETFVNALADYLVDYETAHGTLPVHVIAFGNEWSNAPEGGYPGPKEDFVAQQNIVYSVVKDKLPGVPVAIGGMGASATQAYAFCKGYLELEPHRETFCGAAYATGIVATTEYVLANANFDLVDQHLYDFPNDWPHMINALVNDGLPAEKQSLPIVVSEFGGPNVETEPTDETYQATQLDAYILALSQMDVGEAHFYRLVEDGAESGGIHQTSGLISRDRFKAWVEGGPADIEKESYWVFQAWAAILNGLVP